MQTKAAAPLKLKPVVGSVSEIESAFALASISFEDRASHERRRPRTHQGVTGHRAQAALFDGRRRRLFELIAPWPQQRGAETAAVVIQSFQNRRHGRRGAKRVRGSSAEILM